MEKLPFATGVKVTVKVVEPPPAVTVVEAGAPKDTLDTFVSDPLLAAVPIVMSAVPEFVTVQVTVFAVPGTSEPTSMLSPSATAPPSSQETPAAGVPPVAVPVMLKLKRFSSASFVTKVTGTENAPSIVGVKVTSKVTVSQASERVVDAAHP